MTAGELFIGLMSGTSLDGVDAALVRLNDQDHPEILQTHFIVYPAPLRNALLALQHPTNNELEAGALLANQLAQLYAQTVNELLQFAKVASHAITAIGCHGQTIRHRPELGFTLQIGNAALLAELTKINVVSDFRSRDIASGGQGAPLVPAFHQAIFASKTKNRAIVNIGGIANITYLPVSGKLLGFDSGPGNMLLDMWIKRHLNLDYDANGNWARNGIIIPELLTKMLGDAYFSMSPPKSTGRDLFNENWLNHLLSQAKYAPENVARTLVMLTAKSIHQAIIKFCENVDEIYLCGGGAKNSLLTEDMMACMPEIPVLNTDAIGIDTNWAEAIAFAWLAKACIQGRAINLSAVTGSGGPRILGAIYQA
jgi:anhydro-N-acetylmuramic acid kinase